jgi:hypothetical protein
MHEVNQVQPSQREVQQKHVYQKYKMWSGINAANCIFLRPDMKKFSSLFLVAVVPADKHLQK